MPSKKPPSKKPPSKKPAAKKPAAKKPAAKKPAAKQPVKEEKNTENTSNGTLAGGGLGSFALGTGGAIAGYNLGSKAGDYLYKKGRQLATGEIKLPGKKSFKKFKDDVSNKVKNLNLSNLGRNKSDKK